MPPEEEVLEALSTLRGYSRLKLNSSLPADIVPALLVLLIANGGGGGGGLTFAQTRDAVRDGIDASLDIGTLLDNLIALRQNQNLVTYTSIANPTIAGQWVQINPIDVNIKVLFVQNLSSQELEVGVGNVGNEIRIGVLGTTGTLSLSRAQGNLSGQRYAVRSSINNAEYIAVKGA